MNVGDKVRIKKDIETIRGAIIGMSEFAGTETYIASVVSDNTYVLVGNPFLWHSSMLECTEKEGLISDIVEVFAKDLRYKAQKISPDSKYADMLEKKFKNKCKESLSEDNVNPSHYDGTKCIEEMELMFGVEQVKAFCRVNAYKYQYRASRKNGEEDLKKAQWYIDYLEKLENR